MTVTGKINGLNKNLTSIGKYNFDSFQCIQEPTEGVPKHNMIYFEQVFVDMQACFGNFKSKAGWLFSQENSNQLWQFQIDTES